MYRDTDSVRVFKRQHARDDLVRMARVLADPPDTDLVSGHAVSAAQEAWLVRVAGLVVILTMVATLAWFIVSSGRSVYGSVTQWPACVFPTAAEGCFGSQPAP
jgi:hypothetical protein